MKRVFLVVLDSFGIGYQPDAEKFRDLGANTLKSIRNHKNFCCPNLKRLGLFNIDGIDNSDAKNDIKSTQNPIASFARLQELSNGKDTTIGHWEIAGIVSEKPLPTYPNGFPKDIIKKFENQCGKKTLCNKPYSGTEVIKDYGKEMVSSENLIVYTSADSVFQIAAHEDIVPVSQLYQYCHIARKILHGKHGVGRVIARPFTGNWPFKRTANRHDFSLIPPKTTMLDLLKNKGFATISVGKIYDIFAGKGLSEHTRTKSNADGMSMSLKMLDRKFEGLCFINLVDFDMKYGHRNDIAGYANALTEFDKWLPSFFKKMKKDDVLIITADHGCDPGYLSSTDHSREYVPMIITGDHIKQNVNLNTRLGFCDISATILEYFNVDKKKTCGNSFLNKVFIK